MESLALTFLDIVLLIFLQCYNATMMVDFSSLLTLYQVVALK